MAKVIIIGRSFPVQLEQSGRESLPEKAMDLGVALERSRGRRTMFCIGFIDNSTNTIKPFQNVVVPTVGRNPTIQHEAQCRANEFGK